MAATTVAVPEPNEITQDETKQDIIVQAQDHKKNEDVEKMEEIKEELIDLQNEVEESEEECNTCLEEEEEEEEEIIEGEPAWEDILDNGQLMKKITVKGQNWTKPTKGDICILNIKGCIQDTNIIVEKHDELEIFVGEGDIIHGLDLVIILMNTGEEAKVKVDSRFAYGELGDGKDIPPNCSIMYTVKLLEIKQFDITQMSFSQRRDLGCSKRLRGNWWFERKEMYNALQCYQKALAFISIENLQDEDTHAEGKDLQELSALSLIVRNNMAAAQIILGFYDEALDNVSYVLTRQPNNIKALYRKAKILMHKRQHVEAYDTYVKLKKWFPQLKNTQDELSSLAEIIMKDSKEEKNLYRKMLGMKQNGNSSHASITKNEVEMDKIKNGTSKKILFLIGGTSAVIFSIFIHKFIL